MDEAMVKFEKYEAKIDGLEAQLESYDLGQVRSLKEQFAELEQTEKLDAELQALKARLGKGQPTGGADKK
jgi:phage shock protein A